MSLSLNERCPSCQKRLSINKVKKQIMKVCSYCSEFKGEVLFPELYEKEPKKETQSEIKQSKKSNRLKIV